MTFRDRIYSQLARLALSDFADIVEGTKFIEGKLRLLLKDQSFIDITTFLIEKPENSKPIPNIFTIRLKGMW